MAAIGVPELLRDRDFRNLPRAEQLKGLREADPDFARLPESEQGLALDDPAFLPIPAPPSIPIEPAPASSALGELLGAPARGAANVVLAIPRVLSQIPGGVRDFQAAQLREAELAALGPAARRAHDRVPQSFGERLDASIARQGVEGRARQQSAAAAAEAGDAVLPAAPVTTMGQLLEGFGSTLPFLASAAVPGGPAVLSIAAGLDEALARADASGKPLDAKDRTRVLLGGGAVGASEMIPLERVLGVLKRSAAAGRTAAAARLEEMFPRWRDYFRSAATQAAEEGAQETAGGLAQDVVESTYGGRREDQIGEGWKENLALGGGVGSMLDLITKPGGSRYGRRQLGKAGITRPDQLRALLEGESRKAGNPAAGIGRITVDEAGERVRSKGDGGIAAGDAAHGSPRWNERFAGAPDQITAGAANRPPEPAPDDLPDETEKSPEFETDSPRETVFEEKDDERDAEPPEVDAEIYDQARALARQAGRLDVQAVRLGLDVEPEEARRILKSLIADGLIDMRGNFIPPQAESLEKARGLARREGRIDLPGLRNALALPPGPARSVFQKLIDEGTVNAKGRYIPREADAPALAATEEAELPEGAAKPIPDEQLGKKGKSSTVAGTGIDYQFAALPLDAPIASHNVVGEENPDYPKQAQPRKRDRAASVAQYAEVGSRLDYGRLNEDPLVNFGAPVIGADWVSEAGTGRLNSLRWAAANRREAYDKYKADARADAGLHGIAPETLDGIGDFVIVRVRRSPVNRAQFAREANVDPQQRMSPSEVAAVDAGRIGDLLERFDAEGEITGPSNRDFVRAFMQSVAGPTERSALQTADGMLSQEGVRRIRTAIFARAYGDPAAIETLAESTDSDIRGVTAGMLRAAPALAKVQQGIQAGALHDRNLAPDAAEAARKLAWLKQRGTAVEHYLSQGGLLGREISPEARRLLEVFAEHGRSPRAMGNVLIDYARQVEALGHPQQAGLFGEAAPPSKLQILEAAIARATGVPERPAAPESAPATAPAPRTAPSPREVGDAPVGDAAAEGGSPPAEPGLSRDLVERGRPEDKDTGKPLRESAPKIRFASTQANLPPAIAQGLLDAGRRIPDAELAEDGREHEPHVTVLYGLHGSDPDAVRELLAGEGPVRIKFGRASLFSKGDADVLKVDVESDGLRRLNEKIATLPHTNTHGKYKPHATIAYLKPGKGKKYAGRPVAGISGREVTLHAIAVSDGNGGQVEIPLRAAPEKLQQNDADSSVDLDAERNRLNAAIEAQARTMKDAGPEARPVEAVKMRSLMAEQQALDRRRREAKKPSAAPTPQGAENPGAAGEEGPFFARRRATGDAAARGKHTGGGIVRLNHEAGTVLHELLGADFAGANLNRREAAALYQRLMRRARNARGAERAALERLARVVAEARRAGPDVILLNESDGGQAERHERFHRFQRAEGAGRVKRHIDADAFFEDPLARRAAEALAEGGYAEEDAPALAAEIGAHLAAGQWDAMGLSDEEAAELFERYVDALIARHGKEVLHRIPEVAKTLEGVLDGRKEREDFQAGDPGAADALGAGQDERREAGVPQGVQPDVRNERSGGPEELEDGEVEGEGPFYARRRNAAPKGSRFDIARTSLSRIAREGPEGARLAQMIDRANDLGETAAGQRVAELADLEMDRWSREDRFHLTDVLEGRARARTQEIAGAAAAIRRLFADLAAEASTIGVMQRRRELIRPGDPRPPTLSRKANEALDQGRAVVARIWQPFRARSRYFPHEIPRPGELKNRRGLPNQVRADVIGNLVRMGVRADQEAAGEFLDDYIEFMESGARVDSLIRYLVRDGQASSSAQAFQMLLRHRQHQVRRQGSLEYSREVNLPFFDPDPARVLPNQVAAQSIRLAKIALFGQGNQAVRQAVDNIRNAHGEARAIEIQKSVDEILGHIEDADSPEARASRLLRTLMGFRLGLASIANSTQGALNTALAGDIQAVLAGFRGMATAEGRRFGLQSGASLESALSETRRNAGTDDSWLGVALSHYLKATGFSATERYNRIFAANAGANYAGRLLDKARQGDKHAARRLGLLGIDAQAAIARDGLTQQEVLIAAKKFSDMTQFRSRPEDSPIGAATPYGKMFWQFKPFIYGQTRLLQREIWGELRAGNWRRAGRALLVLGTVFPLTGEAIETVRNLITGREDDDEGLRSYLDGVAQTGALGFLSDMAQQARYGRLQEWGLGPSLSTLLDGAERVLRIPMTDDAGKAAASFGKWAWRQFPLIGQLTYHRLFGQEKEKKPLLHDLFKAS